MECRQSFGGEPAYTRRCERRRYHAAVFRRTQAWASIFRVNEQGLTSVKHFAARDRGETVRSQAGAAAGFAHQYLVRAES